MYIWQKDLCPSTDSRSKGILDLVHLEEAQELEATTMMSSTVYNLQFICFCSSNFLFTILI
jgi:hypothetical protein